MNNSGARIKYGNYAVGAKENFEPFASETLFDTLSQLKEYNLVVNNYSNPCELYQFSLDGSASIIPDRAKNYNIGFWSRQISDYKGVFINPIVLTLYSEHKFSAKGISFVFDSYNEIFANDIIIKWYRDEEIISEMPFHPTDAQFNCENEVHDYNKIEIVFYSINAPENRLKITSINHGMFVWFESKNLQNIKLIQECDPISMNISVNTADFVLNIDSDADYMFQKKQPVFIYFDGNLKSTTFVNSFKRKSKNIWSFQTEDYIGLLDEIPYTGGMFENSRAIDVLSDIFSVARVPFYIDNTFASATITGHIPYTTCRDALMQVCFAIGAVVDTSNSEIINIFSLSDDIKQNIPLSRIMQGQNYNEEGTVTGVSVTYHSYKKSKDVVTLYTADSGGVGENIFIKFSQPMYDLEISNGNFALGNGGQELKNANYAIINAKEGCVLTGKKYEHSENVKKKNNPDAWLGEADKIISVESATLVSKNNIDKIIEICYNYFTNTKSVNSKIIEGKHFFEGKKYGQKKYGTFKYGSDRLLYDKQISVGDIIDVEMEYGNNYRGRVIKQTFNLNGGIIVKTATIK